MKDPKKFTDYEAVRQKVRTGYGQIAQDGGSCCSSAATCCGSAPADAQNLAKRVGYSLEELAALPEEANLGLSCGNPNALAALKPGEVVLDLGSGGGFDVFIAGKKVGPSGRVIGVDMTPEMLSKARKNAEQYHQNAGLDNVEFRLGEIEHLPVADGSVDAVISNCVINLSPDKPQVWREIARVLKPGGRVAVSDLALLKPLPPAIVEMVEALVGCVAGAVLVSDTERMAKEAGLGDVALKPKAAYVDGMVDWQGPLYQKIIAHLPVGAKPSDYITSLEITARKPQPCSPPFVAATASKPPAKVEVFDPAMCCSTGVCGPTVEPKLAQFAADLDWLKSQGVPVERYNLAQTPGAFAANATVRSALDKHGTDCLPLMLVDGSIASVGGYPTRVELAHWAALIPSKKIYSDPVNELVAIGAAIVANSQPCFKHHHQRAQALGVSEDDMTSAVNTAMAVKRTADRETLQLADQMLASVPEKEAREGGCGCSSKSGCC
ncbi:Arsenical resistance operon trans-acting repressor ArsD (modular protein) [Verrucomicrobia bacterium]|nr:Arsenical resistance operon trans-acting repressor ArsD (modular protein) [Verrucomicrobiota bacterium]